MSRRRPSWCLSDSVRKHVILLLFIIYKDWMPSVVAVRVSDMGTWMPGISHREIHPIDSLAKHRDYFELLRGEGFARIPYDLSVHFDIITWRSWKALVLLEGQENLAYIPLSSLIILLVILLTCASRRKKIDAFSAVEQNLESDIKEEYAIMCFPCLKKKPDITDFEPTEDLSEQFEYIVEKYTIRKVPLLLANTTEDIIERQEELEIAKASETQPQLIKDSFVNFQISQELFNVQKSPPYITLAANTSCPGKRALKERSKPSDILESMSPICRPPVRNHNYVVIPTRGSLRHKDIMMTKREITNQYLNNFSSVFVDNLKDQVPKDPERFPSLSRPYTSAFKTFPFKDNQLNKVVGGRKSKKGKNSKVAYTYPVEEIDTNENSIKEEQYYDSDSAQEQTTDMLESEFQEDPENDMTDFTDKSKSLFLLNGSESEKNHGKPFKTLNNSMSNTVSGSGSKPASAKDLDFCSLFLPHGEDWSQTKNVTYEDIQALDVGYEFTSSEKLGVKPKMTRVHYPIEPEKFKESLKLALGDTSKMGTKNYPQEHQVATKASRNLVLKSGTAMSSKALEGSALHFGSALQTTSRERISLRNISSEAKYLEMQETASEVIESLDSPEVCDTDSFTNEDNKCSNSFNNQFGFNPKTSATGIDSVTEISELYDLSRPVTQRKDFSNSAIEPKELAVRNQTSKSLSFHEAGPIEMRNENKSDIKGKNSLSYPNSAKKFGSRLDEHDTETSYSLDSRDSKTSSVVTTPRSSEVDEERRATLRWKIVIKHHREDDSSKRNVNVNIKH